MWSGDDDGSWSGIAAPEEEEEEDEEDVPVVAEFPGERPDKVKPREEFQTNSKWKLLGDQEDSQSSGISGPAKAAMRRQRHDSPEPWAPGGNHSGSLELCTPRQQRHDSPEPWAPGGNHSSSLELCTPRQQRHDSPEPWAPGGNHSGSLELCTPRQQRHDSPEPSAPGGNHSSSLELCTPRQQRHDTPDPSPPRRRGPGTPELAPPWWQRQDLSPRRETPGTPRGKRSRREGWTWLAGKGQHRSRSPPGNGRHRQDAEGSTRKAPRMSSRARAGLLLAQEWQREKQELRRHERSREQLEEESWKAQTVFRDKRGRRRNLAQEQLEQRLRAGAEARREERYSRWGKGLAQQRQQQQNVEDATKEMQKPLARSINDQDLDRMLREQEREGDPMAALIKKRKAKENKEKEKPRYKGPAPPLNRFHIWPGHRWDGVDRSKGLEQQRCARGASTKVWQQLPHECSIQDRQDRAPGVTHGHPPLLEP